MESNITEKDIEKVVEFLNFIGTRAEFNKMDVKDTIKLFGLLSFMQQTLIKKLQDNLLEITSVKEAKPAKTKAKG